MSFWKGNTTNVEEGGGFNSLEGENCLKIVKVEEVQTKAGDPMAKVEFKAIGKPGKAWDNIVFPLPDSSAIAILGRSKHFLHCLGLPYDDENLNVNPSEWIDKVVKVQISVEPYENKKGETKQKNVIDQYLLSDEQEEWDS